MSDPRSPGISFDTERQGYVLAARPELRFRRCSEFVESFFDPFDGPAIAEKLVSNHAKYAGRTVEELVAEWRAAGDDGTEVHRQVQVYAQEGAEPASVRGQHAARWLDATYPSAQYVRVSEVIVYDSHFRLAGTADMLVRPKTGDRWTLIDWKTNKKIERFPFRGKRGVRGPARLWPDCNYHKYSLQISLYRYLLERERSLSFDRQLIVHLTLDGAVPIDCSYYKSSIDQMLDHDIAGPSVMDALDAL